MKIGYRILIFEIESSFHQNWRRTSFIGIYRRRIVFNIYVSNTDDHLRNHGFLLTNQGWILSPAYDINPIETGIGLKLNISENDNALNLDLALEVAPFFRVSQPKAKRITEEIKEVVSTWQMVANKYKIGRNEQEMISRAFMQ